jgi:hypothetical protein
MKLYGISSQRSRLSKTIKEQDVTAKALANTDIEQVELNIQALEVQVISSDLVLSEVQTLLKLY